MILLLLGCTPPDASKPADADDTAAPGEDTASDTGDTAPDTAPDTGADTASPDPGTDDAVVFGYEILTSADWGSPTVHLLGPDFDGDGTSDLVLAQEGFEMVADSGACTGPGLVVIPGGTRNDGRASIWSAFSFHMDRDECFGASLDTAPDMDGDGLDELLVTKPAS